MNMDERKESAVKLNNKCQHNHWSISWRERENKDATVPHERWTAWAIINGREYAWGQGSKKGHAHEDAAVKVFDILGEDSIARLQKWVAHFGWCLDWQNLPVPPSTTTLVWRATALVNGVPYGSGHSTFYTCAQEEAAKQALDRLINNSEFSET